MSSITFNLSPASRRYLRELGKRDRVTLYRDLDRLFDREATLIAGHISRTKLRGNPISTRSGALARAVVGRGIRLSSVPAVRVGVLSGPATRYASTLEYGTSDVNPESPIPGPIRPKTAKALAIPSDDPRVKTPAGVGRFVSPRDYPRDLTFVPFPRARKLIGGLYDSEELKGARSLAEINALFFLAREVSIEPRYFLRDGFLEKLPLLERKLADLLERQFA